MGDFTYLGRETLERAQRLIADADAAFAAGGPDAAHLPLGILLDECFSGGGADGPDDGAVDQLVTVVEALDGDEIEEDFLRRQHTEEGGSWVQFLQSYALDDLRDTLTWSLAELDAGRGEAA